MHSEPITGKKRSEPRTRQSGGETTWLGKADAVVEGFKRPWKKERSSFDRVMPAAPGRQRRRETKYGNI
jgi:hypothetical protein